MAPELPRSGICVGVLRDVRVLAAPVATVKSWDVVYDVVV